LSTPVRGPSGDHADCREDDRDDNPDDGTDALIHFVLSRPPIWWLPVAPPNSCAHEATAPSLTGDYANLRIAYRIRPLNLFNVALNWTDDSPRCRCRV
jgi:hypothetical protein